MIDLATQERIRAIEQRVEQIEARIADSEQAIVDEQGLSWGHGDRRWPEIRARILHGYEHQALLLERERLQEESFKLWQSARRSAEAA